MLHVIAIMMWLPAGYYFNFFSILELSFQVYASHVIPISYSQQWLLISHDNTALPLGIYALLLVLQAFNMGACHLLVNKYLATILHMCMEMLD